MKIGEPVQHVPVAASGTGRPVTEQTLAILRAVDAAPTGLFVPIEFDTRPEVRAAKALARGRGYLAKQGIVAMVRGLTVYFGRRNGSM